MIRVICTCGRAFKAEDRHAGRQTKCPECGAALTIGPAPGSGPRGAGVDDVPSWWNSGAPSDQAARATTPTRSGSDPGIGAANGMSPPPKSEERPRSPDAGSSPPAAASPPDRIPRTIVGGTAAVLLVATGLFLWLRSGTPAADGPVLAPRGADLSGADAAGRGQAAAPPATGRENHASDRRIAPSSSADPGTDASPPEPRGDSVGASRAPLAGASRGLKMLVPAYIYPGGDGRKEWQKLFNAASRVPIVVIANPNSGPGEDRDLEYDAIFTEAGKRGITLVGYVSTDFGKRPREKIQRDIDTWIRLYPQIRGVFFDQQPPESRHAPLYAALRSVVRQKMRDPLVITNPGIPCDEAFLSQGVSDVTCVFVNYQGFERFDLPATLTAYDASHFAAMPYNIPDAETMRNLVKEAVLKRIGYLYISDAKPPNSWGKLPDYWDEEVEAVSRYR